MVYCFLHVSMFLCVWNIQEYLTYDIVGWSSRGTSENSPRAAEGGILGRELGTSITPNQIIRISEHKWVGFLSATNSINIKRETCRPRYTVYSEYTETEYSYQYEPIFTVFMWTRFQWFMIVLYKFKLSIDFYGFSSIVS